MSWSARSLDLPQRDEGLRRSLMVARSVGRSISRGRTLRCTKARQRRRAGRWSGFVASTSSNGLNGVVLDPTKIASALSGGGLLAGVLGKSFNVAGMSVPSFGVVLQALETSSNTNVLLASRTF